MDISETMSLGIISKENDVIDCAYSDVPLLVKMNPIIRRSELTCSPATYFIYLMGLVTWKARSHSLPLLRVGIYVSLSLGLFQVASQLLPYKEISYKFNLLSGSLPVVAKAVPYVDTNYDYNNAWMSMGKVAVHCTSTQSLHCETRNRVFKSFSSY